MARSFASERPRWFAALLMSVALSAPALAQDELDAPPERTLSAAPDGPPLGKKDADRKARQLFEQGKQAYEDGQYRDSWDYFRQAYLLSKRPELLYNVGQSADRLRMDREALEAFKLYLARLPEAENRREVENRVRALEARLREEQARTASAEAEEDPAYAGLSDQDDDPHAMFAPEKDGDTTDGDDDADGDDTETAEAPSDGQPLREGWYANVALGLGLLHDSIGNLTVDATLGSLTLAGQVALGHQVLEPGFVLGGALMFEWGLSPSVSVNDFDADIDTANLSMLGPFVEYYLDPRQHGWHLFGAIAIGWLSLSDRSATIGVEDARGGALVLGGGYEWPFGRDWAIGALARLTLAKVDQDTGKHALGVLSVLCNATWF